VKNELKGERFEMLAERSHTHRFLHCIRTCLQTFTLPLLIHACYITHCFVLLLSSLPQIREVVDVGQNTKFTLRVSEHQHEVTKIGFASNLSMMQKQIMMDYFIITFC
jgi:hypothetical protein